MAKNNTLSVLLGIAASLGGLAPSSTFAQEVPMCLGKPATIYVLNGKIVGGPDDGKEYKGTLRGSNGDDVIVGTSGIDVIFGRAGNDTICAGAGNDVVIGGRRSLSATVCSGRLIIFDANFLVRQ